MDRELARKFLAGEVPASALPETKFGPNGPIVYERTYSRPLFDADGNRHPWTLGDTEGRTHEVWPETARRVTLGNTSLSPETLLDDEDVALFEAICNMDIVPAGRHLWVDGTGLAYSRNCWSAPMGKRTSGHFRFLASRLFEGGGVGANYSNDMLADTTPVDHPVRVHITCREDHPDILDVLASANGNFVSGVEHVTAEHQLVIVPDTREGWVDAWAGVIDTACDPAGAEVIVFDVSDIRPFGAPLLTYGGTASGPAPLVSALLEFERVLGQAAGRRLNSMEAMDLDHAIAASVVAGGARRSARLACKNWADEDIFDFIDCKADFSKHWSTNISVEADDDFYDALEDESDPMHEHATKVLEAVATGMALNGEPGLLNSSRMSEGENTRIRTTNPCVTGDTWVQTTEGLRQVDELVGKGKVELAINGEAHASTDEGFFHTGHKRIIGLNIDGSVLKLTPEHKVMTPDGWVEAQNLMVGDVVALNDGTVFSHPADNEDTAKGYLLGLLVGDGTFSSEDNAILCEWGGEDDSIRNHVLRCIERLGLKHRGDWTGWREAHQDNKRTLSMSAITQLAADFGIVRGNKTITDEVMKASADLRRGFLSGLFDADGHVEFASRKGGISVRLSQSDSELLSRVRIMLLDLGIRSVVRHGRDAGPRELPGGTYECKVQERLIISSKGVRVFRDTIGFACAPKRSKLDESLAQLTYGFYNTSMVGKVVAITDEGVEDVYDVQVPGINAFVAQGVVVANCGEIPLETEGDSYGEACNIGSVNLDHVGTDYDKGVRLFGLLGRFLYRATLKPYPGEDAQRIEARNRRIGAGFMGLQEWAAHHGIRMSELPNHPEMTDRMEGFRSAVRRGADGLADQLGLPHSIKVTTVAPNGSISKLPGAGAGIHPVIARYAEQRIRFGSADPKLDQMRAKGYSIEPCVYAANTMVVTVPTRDSIMDKGFGDELVEQADEVSLDAFLGLQRWVQETYCGGGDGNAVSATANIAAPDADDPDAVANSAAELSAMLRKHGRFLKGTTVFPNATREQQPITPISREDYDALVEFCEAMSASFESDCSTGACPVR